MISDISRVVGVGIFDCRSIEELADIIIVGRRRDDNEIRIAICSFFIYSCVQIQLALAITRLLEKYLNLIVLYWTVEIIKLLSLRRCCGDCGNFVILREEYSQ